MAADSVAKAGWGGFFGAMPGGLGFTWHNHLLWIAFCIVLVLQPAGFAVDLCQEMSDYVAACQTMGKEVTESLPSLDGPLAGTFEHALDPKRRITIPAVWREVMGAPAHLYVMADPHDPCLTILPPSALQPRLQRLRQQPLFDESVSEALRDFFAEAEYLALDVQGRIRIGDELLAFAQLDDVVLLRGIGVRAQLWSPKIRARRREINPALVANAAKILGI
jgi:MraZ protein